MAHVTTVNMKQLMFEQNFQNEILSSLLEIAQSPSFPELLCISHGTVCHIISLVFTEAGHVYEAYPEEGNDIWKISTWGVKSSDP